MTSVPSPVGVIIYAGTEEAGCSEVSVEDGVSPRGRMGSALGGVVPPDESLGRGEETSWPVGKEVMLGWSIGWGLGELTISLPED